MTKTSFVEKAAIAAGSAALISSPIVADASVVVVDDRPIVIPLFGPVGETIGWDIDGNGSMEFEIFRTGYDSSFDFGTGTARYSYRGQFLASVTYSGAQLNGRGLVAPPTSLTNDTQGEDSAQPLFASFTVGPTLANNYTWGRVGERYRVLGTGTRTVTSYSTGAKFTYSDAYIGYDFSEFGFQPGRNYFGFRFEGDAGLQYGWGVLNYGGGPDGPSVHISYWEYGSEAGEGVHIPEPASALPSLALIGLGAAGVHQWRRRKTDALAA